MRTEEEVRSQKSGARWAGRREELLALGLFDKGSRVRERIEMLLGRGREFSPRASRVRVAVGVAALLGFVIAASIAPRWIAFAQRAEFEVASVKPAPWTGQGCIGCITVRGNTLTTEHVDLYDLVKFAYNLKENIQLSGGPSWVVHGMIDSSDFYQVIAKAAGDMPPSAEQFRLMLQALLADRFKLQVHHVQKDLPVYNLVVAKSVVGKNGSKLKESAADTKFSSAQRPLPENPQHGIQMTVAHETIAQFVSQIGGYTGRPVFDKTGLTGSYDFELEFIEDRLSAAVGADTAPLDTRGASLFTAVQERLGLRFEPGVAPFDTVVIDHAEKPDAN